MALMVANGRAFFVLRNLISRLAPRPAKWRLEVGQDLDVYVPHDPLQEITPLRTMQNAIPLPLLGHLTQHVTQLVPPMPPVPPLIQPAPLAPLQPLAQLVPLQPLIPVTPFERIECVECVKRIARTESIKLVKPIAVRVPDGGW